MTRIAVLWDPKTGPAQLHSMEKAARTLRIESRILRVRDAPDVEPAFAELSTRRIEAVVILSSPAAWAQRTALAYAAARRRLPSVALFADYADAGGTLAYGPKLVDLFGRAAYFVDRIARGARPADLPIERPTRFELVINARSVMAAGLTVPQHLLLRADRVIE